MIKKFIGKTKIKFIKRILQLRKHPQANVNFMRGFFSLSYLHFKNFILLYLFALHS